MLEVRTIRQEDLSELEQLYIQSIKANEQGFIQDLSRSKNIKDFVLDTQKEGGNFVGLFLENKIVGFGGYVNEGAGRLQICKLHLNKTLQGNGFGKLLFATLEADAKYKGFKDFTLHVTNTQENAVKLYQKQGYIIESEKDYEIEIDGKVCHYPTLYMRKKF
ncbi:MAG: GNAT family N-acetyltransferase [Alphaproteobacteria bacterium]|nr:GNAT family N-acetyltransferase [Alphaproteobacteria bacterium]